MIAVGISEASRQDGHSFLYAGPNFRPARFTLKARQESGKAS